MTLPQQTSSKRALVTGASGFVGSNLCQLLVRRGWEVVAVTRRMPAVAMAGVSVKVLSLSANAPNWQETLASIDCVVHLAATVHQMGRTSGHIDYRVVNLEGSKFVATQAATAGVKRFVYLSSIKVNGEGGTGIYRSCDVPLPVDDYGRSKMESEFALREISAHTGMKMVIIRPPLVYGPGVRANFKRLLQLAALGVPLPLGSIRNRRSLIGVDNLVDFVASCMEHPRAAGETWLVSDGEDLSTRELVAKLMCLMEKKPRFFPMPPRLLKSMASIVGQGSAITRLCDSMQVDITPALDILGWRPPRSVDDGLASTVADYRGMWRQ